VLRLTLEDDVHDLDDICNDPDASRCPSTSRR